jgi:hypothetical protein
MKKNQAKLSRGKSKSNAPLWIQAATARLRSRPSYLLAPMIMIVLFQNCSPFSVDSKQAGIFRNSSLATGEIPTPSPAPVGPTPIDPLVTLFQRNTVADCMSNPNYDACLFWKNPVASRGSAFSTPLQFGTTQADTYQNHGVKLDSSVINSAGQLQTSSFINMTVNPLIISQNRFKKLYSTDASTHQVAQLQSFYWLAKTEAYMKGRTGSFYSSGRGVRINLYDVGGVDSLNSDVRDNAYFQFDNLSAHVGYASVNPTSTSNVSRLELALDAEITIHEAAHGEQYLALGRTDGDIPDANSVNCGANLCCASVNGCRNSMGEAISDIYAMFLFRGSSGIGQTWENSTRGLQGSLGVSRDPETLNFTPAQYFSGAKEIHEYGVVYVKIWYIARQMASQNSEATVQNLEKLFMEHMKSLTSADTYLTTYTKLRGLDQSLFSGQFANILKNAYTQTGYAVN